MLYIYRLTIPANTAESDKEQIDFRLPNGTLSKLEVAFPPGPEALTYFQVYHNEHQLFPANPGGTYRWDNFTVIWEGEYDLPEAWNHLSLRGWNLDDTFEHEITARFSIAKRLWGPADLAVIQIPLSQLEK